MDSLLQIYASGDYGKLRDITLAKKEQYLREFFSDCYQWCCKEPITATKLDADFKQFFEHDVVPNYATLYIYNAGL